MKALEMMWTAWTPAQDLNKQFTDEHFEDLLDRQIEEIFDHTDNNNTSGRLNEMIDIMSIAMNWIRQSGVQEFAEFEKIMYARVLNRYLNQTQAIVKRDIVEYNWELYQ